MDHVNSRQSTVEGRWKPALGDACLLVILVASLGAMACVQAGRPVGESGSGPGCAAEPVDLGRVGQSARVPFSCTLSNRSRQAIRIRNITRPCACAELDLEPGRVIEAGGRITVPGVLDTRHRRGRMEMAIPVDYTYAGRDQVWTCVIPLSFDAVPTIRLDPERLALADGEWSTVILRSDQPFRIKQINRSGPHLVWEAGGGAEPGTAREHVLRVGLAASKSVIPLEPVREPDADWVLFETDQPVDERILLPITLRVGGG
jgi:hypothetical protein